jgi:hypothetical protein
MKNRKLGITCLISICICAATSAQKLVVPHSEPAIKSKIFKDVPDRLTVNANKIFSLISLKAGEVANIPFSDKFVFKGPVVSSVSKYDGAIQSTIIKSTDYPGATFTVSRIKSSDGSISYRGRIVSFQHGDCFELKTENGQFILIKKNFELMVND